MSAKSRMIVVAVIAPLIFAAAGIVTMLAVVARLPDPIAVHWGFSGAADRFGSPVGGFVLLAVFGLAFAALGFAIGRTSEQLASSTQRFLLALLTGLSALLAWVFASSVVLQVGLVDAHAAPSILPAMIAGFAIGVVVGVVAWFALPRPVALPAPEPVEVAPVELREGERVSFIQRLEPSRAVGVLAIGILAVALVGGGVVMALFAPTVAFVIWTVVMLAGGLLSVAALFWSVTIDRRGLVVRLALGFPRFVIPAAEVATATTTDIVPLRDFGGWGIRGVGQRIGVIVRSGEAIEVTRKDGRVFVVTVPQSTRGAALLNALAARA